MKSILLISALLIASCYATCQKCVGLGATCSTTSSNDQYICATGTYCSSSTLKCTALKQIGESCSYANECAGYNSYAATAYCTGGKCKATVAIGGNCSSSSDCKYGSNDCSGVPCTVCLNNTCIAGNTLATGAQCLLSAKSCKFSDYCSITGCAARVAAGGACGVLTGSCKYGYACNNNVCVAIHSLAPGALCYGDSSVCQGGYVCSGTGLSTTWTCQVVPQNTSACTVNSDCKNSYYTCGCQNTCQVSVTSASSAQLYSSYQNCLAVTSNPLNCIAQYEQIIQASNPCNSAAGLVPFFIVAIAAILSFLSF